MSTLEKVFRHRGRAAPVILAATGMCRLFSSALGAPVEPSTKDALAPNDPSLGAHLQVWLRADALALKDSAQVFRWPDNSGNNRDAAPTIGVYEGTGLPPTFVRSSNINGRPAVHFDLNTALATPGERPLAIEGKSSQISSPIRGSTGRMSLLVSANRWIPPTPVPINPQQGSSRSIAGRSKTIDSTMRAGWPATPC